MNIATINQLAAINQYHLEGFMLTQKETECLNACNDCAVACLYCASECLKEVEPNMMARCITLDIECADFCRIAVASIARVSIHMKVICKICEEVCQNCATECGKHEMECCKNCAETCKHCADLCGGMLQ